MCIQSFFVIEKSKPSFKFDNSVDEGKELIVWKSGKPPQDRTIILPDLQTVSPGLYLPLLGFSLLGIIIAICLLVFNNKFNYRRLLNICS